MIHLINQQNRHLYERQMIVFHKERLEQFVVERGWRLQEREGGEFDEYDDTSAVYLLGLSTTGDLEVGCRLRPTIEGGVLPDVFPHLIADHEAPVRSAGVYECTRYLASPNVRGRKGFEARSKLHIAMQECVLDRGGHRLLGFVDLPLLTHLRRFSGLRLRPVGLPAAYDEGIAIAFEIGVLPQDLAETRRRLEIPTRQLFEAPPWLPENTDVVALAHATSILIEAQSPDHERLSSFVRAAARRVVYQPDVEGIMSRLSDQAA